MFLINFNNLSSFVYPQTKPHNSVMPLRLPVNVTFESLPRYHESDIRTKTCMFNDNLCIYIYTNTFQMRMVPVLTNIIILCQYGEV